MFFHQGNQENWCHPRVKKSSSKRQNSKVPLWIHPLSSQWRSWAPQRASLGQAWPAVPLAAVGPVTQLPFLLETSPSTWLEMPSQGGCWDLALPLRFIGHWALPTSTWVSTRALQQIEFGHLIGLIWADVFWFHSVKHVTFKFVFSPPGEGLVRITSTDSILRLKPNEDQIWGDETKIQGQKTWRHARENTRARKNVRRYARKYREDVRWARWVRSKEVIRILFLET